MKNILIISGFIFLAILIFFGGKLSASEMINFRLISNYFNIDIVPGNFVLFQVVIALLIIIVFTYSGRLFYEWMDKDEKQN